MNLHYDPSLRERLPGTHLDHPLVLNPYFGEFAGHLQERILNRNKWRTADPNKRRQEHKYELPGDRELLLACQKHLGEQKHPKLEGQVVGLVHPFFLSFHQMHLLEKDFLQGCPSNPLRVYQMYIDRLFHVLNHSKRKGYSVVIFESAYDYAIGTSLLLEEGLVDSVILTENGVGRVFDLRDINSFQERQVYMGGQYNGACLASILISLMITASKPEDISVIKGLSLDIYRGFLKFEGSYIPIGRRVPASQDKRLDEVLKIIGLPNLPEEIEEPEYY